MSKQDSSTLKSYFETGDIPTQDSFASLIDSGLNLVDAGVNVATAGQLALQSQINKTITGTVTTTNGSSTVTGNGTKFLTEVAVNGPLIIAGTSYTVTAVASDTSLTISPAFAAAPATVASNVPALVDPGVSLLMSDASGHMSMQLSNGILSVPAGITTGGQVTAAGFSGSGTNLSGIPMSALTGSFTSAQLPDIPANKITGLLNSTQIPPIPASQITGQLAATQVAGLVNLLFYAPAPCISNGALAQISWQTDPGYDLQLDYVDRGTAFSFSSKSGDIARGTGQFPAKIVQSTVFTLTSSVNNQVTAQRQVRVDVIPIPVQYAMQRQYEGYSTEQTIGILARRYSFVALTPNNVTALAGALNTASFPQGEILKYIPAYYIALYGVGSFTQPYMTAMFNGVNQG